jgi:hypothetical protein
MGRVLPAPPAPAVDTNPLEFDRPRDFTGTCDPRDLARALGEGKSFIVGVGATRVVTPDEQP